MALDKWLTCRVVALALFVREKFQENLPSSGSDGIKVLLT